MNNISNTNSKNRFIKRPIQPQTKGSSFNISNIADKDISEVDSLLDVLKRIHIDVQDQSMVIEDLYGNTKKYSFPDSDIFESTINYLATAATADQASLEVRKHAVIDCCIMMQDSAIKDLIIRGRTESGKIGVYTRIIAELMTTAVIIDPVLVKTKGITFTTELIDALNDKLKSYRGY